MAKVYLGNSAVPKGKRYQWVLYVAGATQAIESVTIRLHPTFKSPIRTCAEAPFEFHASGWGTFDIPVAITWKGGEVLNTVWELQFDEPDRRVAIDVPANLLQLAGLAAAAAEAAAPPGYVTTDDDSGSSDAPDPVDLLTALGVRDGGRAAPLPELREQDDDGRSDRSEAREPSPVCSEPARPPAAEAPVPKSKPKAASKSTARATAKPATQRKRSPRRSPREAGARSPSPAAAANSTERSPPRSVAVADSGAGPDSLPPLPDGWRDGMCATLAETPYLRHDSPLFMHGRVYPGPQRPPKCTWKSNKPPRDDHEAPEWLTASEFQDDGDVLAAKTARLAELIRVSRKTVLYTGAGISASVIGQAARSGANTVGWKADTRKAKPTFTHHALGFLGRQGLVHSWVQQNHDGLPQKAGFPQESINEIHGSWYDPGNPVVKYSGTLHNRAFPWMEEDAQTADLVLVLGTSLGGLNADQVPINCAARSLRGRGLGAVIINLQQTEQDGKMSLRIFGKSDDVLRKLLHDLGYGRIKLTTPVWPKESRALVPYDAAGDRVAGGRMMWLDLRDGQHVRLTPDHNIQGARQPMYMHIGADRPRKVGGVMRDPAEGVGRVTRREDDSTSFILDIDGATMRLGIWWLETAMRGAVPVLPLVNVSPVFADG